MVRRAGGPFDRPYEIRRGGLIFRVFGKALQRPYSIQLLAKGRYRDDLIYRGPRGRGRRNLGRQLREQITRLLHRVLLRNTPIKTSRLRTSTRFKRNPARVEQGPSRVRGKSGFYGRIANRRSKRNAGFIERSCTQAARQAQPILRRFRQYRRNIDNVDSVARGRPNIFRGR